MNKIFAGITGILMAGTTLLCGCSASSLEPYIEQYQSAREAAFDEAVANMQGETSSLNKGEKKESPKLIPERVPSFLCYLDNKYDTALAFEESDLDKEIPYISLSEGVVLLDALSRIREDYDVRWGYALNAEDGRAEIARENGSYVVFDWENDIVGISDINAIKAYSYCTTPADIVAERGTLIDMNGEPLLNDEGGQFVHYFERRSADKNYMRSGYMLVSNIGEDYGIDIIYQDGEVYIPLATLNDLFAQSAYLTYNGKMLFGIIPPIDTEILDESGKTMADYFYDVDKGLRSERLADFTYRELCLMLDLNYGLLNEHNIHGELDEFFTAIGVKDALLSTDPAVFEEALSDVMLGYFADRHSGITAHGPRNADTTSFSDIMMNYPRMKKSNETKVRFSSARDEAGLSTMGVLKQGYEEVGDTAFITLDSFSDKITDYYFLSDEEIAGCYMNDTFSLVIYANQMINRENSPIKKVVIDLSNNGGGVADAFVYLASWVLGECRVNLLNPISTSEYSSAYGVDVTLDGIVDERDRLNLDELKVFCLINDNSFSCGNALAAIFKEDSRITMLGQSSGGGACIVYPAVTADGTAIQISGNLKICTCKNGSFYSIDEGVEPDIPIRFPENFYDREWMVEYLDNIK